MVPRRFTDAQEAEIAARYVAGESSLQLATAYSTTHSLILDAVERQGAPKRPPGSRQGALAPKWKGGRRWVNNSGYVMVYNRTDFPEMKRWGNPGSYLAEHRLVLARHLGRALLPHERVHHRNGDRQDNRVENLELWAGAHPSGQRDAHCRTCTCFQ